jgi:hypothetical protein
MSEELLMDAAVGGLQAERDILGCIECLALGHLANAPELAWRALLGTDAVERVGMAFDCTSSPREAFTAFVAWSAGRAVGGPFEVLARALRGEMSP